ncbi:glycosyltransferase family 2 protein [Candidatus Pacearchaeota archaeon]|nr:glycosyltransferase family 2 protein [Candidatus Pacearchaeota archaeon]
MSDRLVSVVIPMYNEKKDIPYCIRSLKAQTHKKIELILVDDGSTDTTIRVANDTARKEKIKIKILNQKHGGPGKARNFGAKNSKGEILIFVDSDMTFDKDYIKNLIKPINKEVIGTTHDNEIVLNTKNIWSRCWGHIRVSPKDADKVKIFRAIDRKKFLDLGGFDPDYGYADDQTLWFKHKVKPIVAKNTVCYHKNPENLKQIYSQSRWIGASIDNLFTRTKIVNKLFPFFLYLISPIAIPTLSLMKSMKLKKVSVVFPMFVFMTIRYFGTISGITRKAYLDINYR